MKIKDTSPQQWLLTLMMEPGIAGDEGAVLPVALAKVTDWHDLLQTAIYHGVFPSLYRRVADTFPQAVPREVLADWQGLYKTHAQRNLKITTELIQVLRLLESYDITAVPYKGPVLAAVAYGDIALRQFVDLDILISRKDIEKVRDLFVSKGYGMEYSFTKKQERPHLKRAAEFTFEHPQRVLIDLHWRFAADYMGGGGLDAEVVLERRVPVQLEGKTVYSLASEDMLFPLCQHHLRAQAKMI
jgi:hypothetical protein